MKFYEKRLFSDKKRILRFVSLCSRLTKISESPEDQLDAASGTREAMAGRTQRPGGPGGRQGDGVVSPTEYDDSLLSMISKIRFETPSYTPTGGSGLGTTHPVQAPPPDYYMSEAAHGYPVNLHSSQTPFSPFLHLTWVSPTLPHRSAFSYESSQGSRSTTNPVHSRSYHWKSPYHPNYNTPIPDCDQDLNLVPPGTYINRLPTETPAMQYVPSMYQASCDITLRHLTEEDAIRGPDNSDFLQIFVECCKAEKKFSRKKRGELDGHKRTIHLKNN